MLFLHRSYGGFANQPLLSRNHIAHRGRTLLNYVRIANMQDPGGSPRTFIHFQSPLVVSTLVARCITYVKECCYPPLPAEERRKGDYKTTTWVIVGGRTGTWDFLDRLPASTSPSDGITSSVLDLSYSSARTHLNTFSLKLSVLGSLLSCTSGC